MPTSTLSGEAERPQVAGAVIEAEFITALFSEVDEQLGAIPKHPEAHLWPSEVVTLGLLHALKGVGNRPFYRWLTRDYRPLGSVLDVEMAPLDQQSKSISVDKQANDNVVHLCRFGETDRLPDQ